MKQYFLFWLLCGVSFAIDGNILVLPCDQPKFNRGPCDGKFKRWSYDFSKNNCFAFTYRGCMGNQNNFRTQQECTENCVKDAIFYSKLRLPPAYRQP